jgi:hypothetical protein
MHDLRFHSAVTLNTLQKDDFIPYLVPRSFAGENGGGAGCDLLTACQGDLLWRA